MHPYFHLAFFSLLLRIPLALGDCVDLGLGMEDGEIPNDKVTASSELSANTPATNGRLNYTSGSSWCAGTGDANPYLQIDLQTLHIICAVSTQGNSQADQWVKDYKLQLSTDGTTWTDYKEAGQVKVLRGNNDRDTTVKHVIYGVSTRYLRFLPQTQQGRVCMKTEVFGVQQERVCEMKGIGLVTGGAIPDSSFTASSYYDNRYKPSYARLNGNNRGWAPKTTTNPADFLQIDLLHNYVICSVATQGAKGINEWTTNYKIQLSLDGTTFFTYKENNTDKIFNGNSNRNGIIKNSLQEFASAKFIRFWPTAYLGWKALRVEVYGIVPTKDCTTEAIGLATDGTIPDISFTATSYYDHRYKPSYARLNGNNRGWAPKTTTNPADFLKIDLLHKYAICAVATQGANGINEWTTDYKIQLSLDGTTFFTYKENNNEKVFPGNSDQNSITKNSLKEFSSAKFIRFLPTAYYSWKALRVEVYGIVPTKVCKMEAIGLATGGAIPDSSFTASSYYDSRYQPSYGRLHGNNRGWAPKTTTNPADFLQVDLLYEYIICAVATQGANGINEWTTNYKIHLSLDGITFFTYKENNTDKVFPGNSNQRDIIKNNLRKFASAKFIRFQPTAYYSFKALMVEVYGILLTKVPSQPPTDFNLTASSSTSIAASWQLPPILARHGRSIIGFKLFYKEKSSAGLETTLPINSGSTLSQNVVGLDKYTEYEFQILAFTSDGDGPKTPVKVKRTEEDVPSGSPGNFTVTASSSTSVTAFWQLPSADFRNGIIIGFKLFYKRKSSGEPATIITINNGTTSAKDITGLVKYTEYELQVLAFTSVGDGPKSSSRIERTKEDVPSKPPNNFTVDVISSTSIKASWQLPPEDSRNGVVRGFKLYYKKRGSTGLLNTLTIGNETIRTKDVIGLDKYTRYEFQVLAFTSVGDGAISLPKVARTKEDVPSQPPRNFSVTVSSSTSVTASWKLPSVKYRHGIVLGFKLYYKKTGSSGLPNTLTIRNESVGTVEFTGLDKYTEYEFQVLAFTSAGDGPKSSAEVARTKEDVPSKAPSNFSVTASNSTSITASWQLPPVDSRNGVITGFKLFFKKRGSAGLPAALTMSNGQIRFKHVTGLDKYSEYEFQVLAFTSTGDGPRSAVAVERTMEDVPSQPPRNFSVTVSSSTSVTASWKLPSVQSRHGIVLGFKLYYKKTGSSGLPNTLTIKNESIGTVDVIGLDKYTEYEFQLLAFTSAGDGPKSSAEVARTKEDVPSKAPSNFSVTASNSTSITASWQLPPADSRNGVITGFKLFFKKRGSAGLPAALTMSNGQIRFKHVTGLDKYSEYEFQVLAFTSTGDGPRSAVAVERTMEDVPSQPPSDFSVTVSSSTSVAASWKLPVVESRHGVIIGFKLSYKKKGPATIPVILNFTNGTVKSKDITGLDKYTEYEFQVLAYTYVGDGPKSHVIVLRTKEDVPSGSPGNFTMKASSSTSITAFWQLPPSDSRNGIITGFKLFYKRKSSDEPPTIITVNNGTSSVKDITGLAKYTEYECQVLAFTSVGDGPKSSSEITRTKEDVPSKPPRNFSVTVSSSTSITASWQLPSVDSRHGIVTGFKLLYKKKGSTGSSNIITISNGTIHAEDITGLDKYTEYEFQVLAFTSVGDGPKSSPHVERTKEDAPSKAPVDVSVTASSSTSITVLWKPPPENAIHGIIKGFKLFYKRRSFLGSATAITINSGASLRKDFTGLDKYTEYEFQVLAFTSVGDGPKSPVEVERTNEDAPSAPLSFAYKEVAPNKMRGPRLNLTWSKPAEANGIIRNYTLSYANKDCETKQSVGGDAFSYLVDVLGGVTYHFYITAVTIKPGQNGSFSVKTKEYEPSRGPENVLSIEIGRTEYQITWDVLPREVANGFIKIYQVRLLLKESCSSVDASFNSTFNTTKTEILLSSLSICSRYEVSVRAFTVAGPGPYSEPLVIQTLDEVWSHKKPSPAEFSSDGGITAKVTLPNFMGNVSFFQVIVITYRSGYNGVVKPPADFTTQELMTYEEAHKSPVPAAYVTFQFGGNDLNNHQEFTVGDGVQSNSKIRKKRSNGEEYYYNKPLHPNTNYRVFLRAFVTETLYTSSSFIALKTKDKPVIKELPEKTTIIVGEKAELTCKASGDPQPSVTWSKDGDTSIPRANFNNDGRVLVIRDVIHRDSGVYECTASNSFGASHSATTLIVADKQSNFPVAVIIVLCVVFVLLAVIGLLVCKWKNRRARIELNDKTKELNRIICDDMGPSNSSYEQLASSSGPCLQLHSMFSEGQSPAFPDLQGLKFENRAYDGQSVSSEKEIEESDKEEGEEVVNDTGNSVC